MGKCEFMGDVLWHRTAAPAVRMGMVGDDRAVAGMGDGGGGDGRRSGGESKCAADRQTGDRGYSHRFLMKTLLRTPSSAAGNGGRCPCLPLSCALRLTMPSL